MIAPSDRGPETIVDSSNGTYSGNKRFAINLEVVCLNFFEVGVKDSFFSVVLVPFFVIEFYSDEVKPSASVFEETAFRAGGGDSSVSVKLYKPKSYAVQAYPRWKRHGSNAFLR